MRTFPDSGLPMSTMFVRTALLATLALSITACNRESATSGAAADGPQQALQKSIALTREGDIGGLIEHMLPPEEFTRIKADWTSEKDQPPIDDAARARFAETMSKLTAPDAAEVLFKEFEPDIRQFDTQYQQQMPTMVAMGRSYLKGVVQQNQELSVGEKEQATQIIEALATWVEKTRFTDPELVKQTLAVVTDAARQLDLKSLDEARGLNFEQSAPKLKIAFNSLKKVLALYGFSIDQTLDSATTELVSSTADEAVVKVSYKLLDTPFQANVDMVRVGERWYSKDTIEKLKARNAEKAMATATPAAANG
ncbi:hypothetical protein [Dokdonella sp.]|uniref:hypothetical protein n=2 Tax=Dokdonella sp. TaxID=2291710 RepID=UPI002C315436|nr:hypothetical protein [Dokdonella sp.]